MSDANGTLLKRIKAHNIIKKTKELKAKYSIFQFHIKDNGFVIVSCNDLFVAHSINIESAFQAVCLFEKDEVSRYSKEDLYDCIH